VSLERLLQRHGLIRYDIGLTGGRIAAQHVRRIFREARCVTEVRSIDAIVAMVGAGLGVSIVPQPRRVLLEAHGVREVSLGRGAPTRRIALVRRHADAGNRNIDAVFRMIALASR
jgi:DNA-binding transcriptional LysR family regulator